MYRPISYQIQNVVFVQTKMSKSINIISRIQTLVTLQVYYHGNVHIRYYDGELTELPDFI